MQATTRDQASKTVKCGATRPGALTVRRMKLTWHPGALIRVLTSKLVTDRRVEMASVHTGAQALIKGCPPAYYNTPRTCYAYWGLFSFVP